MKMGMRMRMKMIMKMKNENKVINKQKKYFFLRVVKLIYNNELLLV